MQELASYWFNVRVYAPFVIIPLVAFGLFFILAAVVEWWLERKPASPLAYALDPLRDNGFSEYKGKGKLQAQCVHGVALGARCFDCYASWIEKRDGQCPY